MLVLIVGLNINNLDNIILDGDDELNDKSQKPHLDMEEDA